MKEKNKSKLQKIIDELKKPIVPRPPHKPTRSDRDKSKYHRKSERGKKWN